MTATILLKNIGRCSSKFEQKESIAPYLKIGLRYSLLFEKTIRIQIKNSKASFTASGFLLDLQIIHVTIPLPVIGCYNELDLLISGSMADIVYGIDRRTAPAEVEGTLRLSADF